MQQIKIIIAGQYQLVRYIGGGGCGEVFEAVDLHTNQPVAVKMAPVSGGDTLEIENDFYETIQSRRGSGMLPVHFYSRHWDDYGILVLPLLGPSLYDLFHYCEKKFSLKTVLLIADQVLSRLRFLHSRDIIHRDIKPGNLMMGRGNDGNTIYLVDLGYARKKVYANKQVRQYTGQKERELFGTIDYAPKAAHKLQCQTYRDDLESFGYVMIEFLTQGLPWEDISTSKSRDKLVGKRKEDMTLDELCKDVPNVFKEYFQYVRSLWYDQRPDYTRLQNLFRSEFRRREYKYNHVYDWTERRFEEMNPVPASADAA